MKTFHRIPISVLCFVSAALYCNAQAPQEKCPVALTHIELSYQHQGGESKPQLRLGFENRSGKPVSAVIFRLMILDSGGYGQEYPHEFTYDVNLEAGKSKTATWTLDSDAVDIHRTGASALVQSLTYSDQSHWADDGSESCSLTYDYHAR